MLLPRELKTVFLLEFILRIGQIDLQRTIELPLPQHAPPKDPFYEEINKSSHLATRSASERCAWRRFIFF
ncbi:hypothetical protein PC129_g10650 [Phytophthora cactorum]|uniref:Uncharacterized protein n=1 Tax=Phytophthora cactorum TaxID=29920 RepID=A0A8T1I013_9STRA|nr:hypothetical protein PC129_g10650 [Phytophthora cactorum]